MPSSTNARSLQRFIKAEEKKKLKNIREQVQLLSQTANDLELRSMEGWMKHVTDLDLIEENLIRLRDTMENRVYLDKIEETRRELELIGWHRFANRPLSMLEARAAMLRDEMNELNKVATKREKLILRQWSLENDMDLLEKNLAILKLHIDTRLESRGFFDKLLDMDFLKTKTKICPKKLLFKLPKWSFSRKSDETWHYYSQITNSKQQNPGRCADVRETQASVQANPSEERSTVIETIDFSPWDQLFSIQGLTPTEADHSDDAHIYEDSSEDECWNDIDEIYATKKTWKKATVVKATDDRFAFPYGSPDKKKKESKSRALPRKKQAKSAF